MTTLRTAVLTALLLIELATPALAKSKAASKPSAARVPSSTQKLSISDTVEISWPTAMNLQMTPLPSFKATHFLASINGKAVNIVVSRHKPNRLAFANFVKEDWTQILKTPGQESSKASCQEKGMIYHVCKRHISTEKNKAVERIHWNAANDIVSVRVTSAKASAAELEQIVEKISVLPVIKLASGRK